MNIFFSVLALLGLEWLFIITKPSFLSLSPLLEKLVVLPVSIFFLTAILVLLSIPLALFALATNRKSKISAIFISIIPAIIYAFLGLLLIDNFTYTLFKFGIVGSSGVVRIAYLLGFILLFGFLLITIQINTSKTLSCEWQPKFRGFPTVFAVLTIILSGFIVLPFVFNGSSLSSNSSNINKERHLPNIILLTVDGVNASHMSIYGYERQNTPFLDSIKEDLIVSENHFTNCANTSGSITSIFTSKLPTTTRVLYPPDLLRGTDTIEHLPAILREKGYYVAQFGVQRYVDAVALNFQNGFNEVNGASIESRGFTYRISPKFPSNSKLFLQEVEDRLINRLGHIFQIKDMENTYTQITQTQINFADYEKIDQAINLVNQRQEPVFVHVHWMGTHGSKFYPKSTTFSEGIDRAAQEPWNKNLYDDSILDFDDAVANLFNSLNDINEVDNTIVIITSDHGQRYTTNDRLPLIILMSNPLSANRPQKTTENIDISPTILDLLNIPKPRWMQGYSLFTNEGLNGPTFSTTHVNATIIDGVWSVYPQYSNPPFYQINAVALIDCNKYYKLHLQEDGYFWDQNFLPSYLGSCFDKDYLSLTDIRLAIIKQLKADGFEFEESLIPDIY